ncbi:hypothetical protein QVD17_26659 [Tagetes erecta]|uniref:Uncharacterized protein n=1 Tax=Tagetes erecta TaxID=13708 RepID=A0AAD8K6Z6_TARER|nr:hypothetical protein QVD17_26659 [Tagetes erecta]
MGHRFSDPLRKHSSFATGENTSNGTPIFKADGGGAVCPCGADSGRIQPTSTPSTLMDKKGENMFFRSFYHRAFRYLIHRTPKPNHIFLQYFFYRQNTYLLS